MTSAPSKTYRDIIKDLTIKINDREKIVDEIETQIEKELELKEKDRGFLQPKAQSSSQQSSKITRISGEILWNDTKEDFPGQEIMIKDIAKQWEELANLWLVCEQDARQATIYKRQFRYANWIFGGVISAIFGIMLMLTAPTNQQNNQQNWQRIIGFLFTGGGVAAGGVAGGFIVNQLDKYTDSKASRQRSVDLRSLKEDVSSQMTDIKIQLKHYFDQDFYQENLDQKKLAFDEFYQKYKGIRDESTRLHKESYKLGVKV